MDASFFGADLPLSREPSKKGVQGISRNASKKFGGHHIPNLTNGISALLNGGNDLTKLGSSIPSTANAFLYGMDPYSNNNDIYN